VADGDLATVTATTSQSRTRIALAARHRVLAGGTPVPVETVPVVEPGCASRYPDIGRLDLTLGGSTQHYPALPVRVYGERYRLDPSGSLEVPLQRRHRPTATAP